MVGEGTGAVESKMDRKVHCKVLKVSMVQEKFDHGVWSRRIERS